MREAGIKRRDAPGPRGRPMHEWHAGDVGKLRLLRTGKMVQIPKPEAPTGDPKVAAALLDLVGELARGNERLSGIALALAAGYITRDDAVYIARRQAE